MLEDHIKIIIHTDEDGSKTIHGYINLHKKIEIDVDTLQQSELDLVSVAKEQIKREIMEEINGTTVNR